jgi:hypothetical protein
MKKEIVIICLFTAMLFASFVNNCILNKLTEEITALAEEAGAQARVGDWETAERLAFTAAETWEGKSGYTHIVLRHTVIETADAALGELIKETLCQSPGGVTGAARAVATQMKNLTEIERVKLGSIF